MRIFAIIPTIIISIIQITARGNQQIVNGVPSDIQPFMVSIRNRKMDFERFGSGHMCGGTILNFNVILTAASCLIDRTNRFMEIGEISIIAGTNQRYEEQNSFPLFLRNITIHPEYNSIDNLNNIALIETWTMPQNLDSIRPINMAIESPIPGDSCQIFGFGQALSLTGPSFLISGTIQIVDRSACHTHNTNTICSSGSTFPCNGDSGGGVICDGQIAGVIDHFDFEHCMNSEEVMHVSYFDVVPYSQWIMENMKRVELVEDFSSPNEAVKIFKNNFLLLVSALSFIFISLCS